MYVICCMCKLLYVCTVVSEIFAGRNFREFREEGRIRENSFAKLSWVCIKWRPFIRL